MRLIILIGLSYLSLIAAASLAAAQAGGISTECTNAGFDYWIAKYDWQNGSYVLTEKINAPYAVLVSGNARSASWTADPAVAGVIEKESTQSYVYPGGTGGIVSRHNHDISHITFCGRGPIYLTEFGSFALVAAVVMSMPPVAYLLAKRMRH